MCSWGSIQRPSVLGPENKIAKGGYECDSEELVKFYDKHSTSLFSITRLVFKISIIPDRNIYIILAGSLAGLPINIITGKSTNDWFLFATEILSSLLFYFSFLAYVLIVNHVREKALDFDTDGCMLYLVPQMRRNIDFAACYMKYSKIRKWFLLSLFFFILTILLVIIEPNMNMIINSCKQMLLDWIRCK